jgi:hypothetical protein
VPLQRIVAQTTCAQQVAEIKAYSKKIDKFIDRRESKRARRIFKSSQLTGDPASLTWEELDGEEEAKSLSKRVAPGAVAFVWVREERVIAADLNFAYATGSVQRAVYYFREDGSLARVSSRLNAFEGEVTISREQFYDQKGLMLSSSSQKCTVTALKIAGSSVAELDTVPVYRTINELPFGDLIRASTTR